MTTFEPDELESESRASRLNRRGRAADPEFTPTEQLYRRCTVNEADNNRLFPSEIKFCPDWSVNREKYSQPQDVLYPGYDELGVAAFQVGDIPAGMLSGGNTDFRWDAQHQPLEDNYAHSELWTYKNGEHHTKSDMPSGVKKYFRTTLSERARIIYPPTALQTVTENMTEETSLPEAEA